MIHSLVANSIDLYNFIYFSIYAAIELQFPRYYNNQLQRDRKKDLGGVEMLLFLDTTWFL